MKKESNVCFWADRRIYTQLQERETLLYLFQLEFHCPLKGN